MQFYHIKAIALNPRISSNKPSNLNTTYLPKFLLAKKFFNLHFKNKLRNEGRNSIKATLTNKVEHHITLKMQIIIK